MTDATVSLTPHADKSAPSVEPAFDTIHARVLHRLPEVVRELGGDVATLLAEAGIRASAMERDEAAISYRQVVLLMEHAARQLGAPDFGLRLAMRQGATMFGPLGDVMRSSRTFGEALSYVSRHAYVHSLAARVWLRREEDGSVFSGHDILLNDLPHRVQAMEYILLAGHLGAVEFTGGGARVRAVHFRHQPVSPMRTYRRHFGCDVRFGQDEDGVLYSRKDMAAPIVDHDARAFAEVTAWIERNFTRHRPPLHAETRGLVMQLLASGDCSNERVARELNLHPRTFHRRLVAEGTTFQKVKDEVRRDIMRYYLEQTRLDFLHVSERLGFSEQSVMTRTCRRWLGGCPSEIRARAAAAR